MAMDDSSTLIIEGRAPSSISPVNMIRKQAGLITFEEHAATPFPVPSTSITLNTFKPEYVEGLVKRLQDIELRVKVMDANNIIA